MIVAYYNVASWKHNNER